MHAARAARALVLLSLHNPVAEWLALRAPWRDATQCEQASRAAREGLNRFSKGGCARVGAREGAACAGGCAGGCARRTRASRLSTYKNIV